MVLVNCLHDFYIYIFGLLHSLGSSHVQPIVYTHIKTLRHDGRGRSSLSTHWRSLHGNTFAITFPLISPIGIGPHVLESNDASRLSPVTQQ
jgi:hypothetical protein